MAGPKQAKLRTGVGYRVRVSAPSVDVYPCPTCRTPTPIAYVNAMWRLDWHTAPDAIYCKGSGWSLPPSAINASGAKRLFNARR